jgi:hypothetical protein
MTQPQEVREVDRIWSSGHGGELLSCSDNNILEASLPSLRDAAAAELLLLQEHMMSSKLVTYYYEVDVKELRR